MCTVTYLPAGQNSYIITSNRDEKSIRKKAMPPRKFQINHQPVFYPKDMQAGGTWIATGNNSFTLCLLNGANSKHNPLPSYRKSRGIMLLDFFKVNSIENFISGYDFKGIEPFTMLIIDTTVNLELFELTWDGEKLNHSQKDAAKPQIWSSVTLYEKEIIDTRKTWFNDWLKNNLHPDMENIMHFHEFGGTGDLSNDLLMNRNGHTQTVSITSIQMSPTGTYMKYKDITEDKLYNIRII